MEVVNAENCVLGRLATEIAKKSLSGQDIVIINADKAVISGRKEIVLRRYEQKRARGSPQHGPFFPSKPEMIVKRAIRGMIAYKTEKGKEAFKKIKVFSGVPEEFKDKEAKTCSKKTDKLNCDFVYVYEVSNFLKGRK